MHIACLTNLETSQTMCQHHQGLLAYDVVNLMFKHQLIARNSNDKTPHIYMNKCTYMCIHIHVYVYVCVYIYMCTCTVYYTCPWL